MDKVLTAPASTPHGPQSFHSISGATVDESGWARGFGERDQMAGLSRFYPGHMEGGVDPHGLQKLEAHEDSVDERLSLEKCGTRNAE